MDIIYKYGYCFKFYDYLDRLSLKCYKHFDHKLTDQECNSFCYNKMQMMEKLGEYVESYSGTYMGKTVVEKGVSSYRTHSIEDMKKILLPYENNDGDFFIEFDYENIDNLSIHYNGRVSSLWKDFWGECDFCPSNDTHIFNVRIISKKLKINFLVSNEDIFRLHYDFESFIYDLGHCLTLEKIE